MSVVVFVRQHWFLIGIIVVIIAANILPEFGAAGGPLHPEITVKYMAVSFIFFSSGLTLKTEDLRAALTYVRLHLYVQLFSLLFVPCLIFVIVSALSFSPLDPWLLNGLLVVGSMPPPVSSAVILTKSVGGNEAAAIFNSALGSFLGIIITPLWLLVFLGSSTDVPFLLVFGQLSITVVFPLLAGQLIRSRYITQIQRAAIPWSSLGSATLLLIIYTTFCDTFAHEDVDIDEMSLFSIIGLVFLLQCSLMILTFYISSMKCFRFKPADCVALLFVTTHKSLTLGIPILRIVYGSDPHLSVMSLPLLIYHPMQILLGGCLVPTVRAWMTATEKLKYPHLRAARYV